MSDGGPSLWAALSGSLGRTSHNTFKARDREASLAEKCGNLPESAYYLFHAG